MNSRYRNVQTMRINWDDIILDTAPIPYPVELTPQEEIEQLEAAIADAEETLRAYASSPRVVAVKQAEIELYEIQIEQWRMKIIVAEQQATNRVRRAEAYGYPADLFRARRAAFVDEIERRNGGE